MNTHNIATPYHVLIASTGFDYAPLAQLLIDKGYAQQLTTVDHVQEIFPLLQQQPIDLLIFINIPTHVETIKLIRQSFSLAALPILVIHESERLALCHAAIAAGANDYLHRCDDLLGISLRIKNKLEVRRIYQQTLAAHNALKDDLAQRLDSLITNSLMLSVEHDRSKLLRHILQSSQKLLNCNAGTLYMVTDQRTLRFTLRTKEDTLPLQEIPLYDPETGVPNERYVSTYTALHNRSIIIDDIYQETRFDLTGTKKFDQESGYRTVSMLTVPMAPRNGEVIGVLQCINAQDPETGDIIPFARELVKLAEALASQAAVALDNLQLVEEQKAVMESMIQVLATAIDAKSIYTGRHCERVPELAMMLAREACETQVPPFHDFNFASQDEWQEFRIGAWLHDCGKVTTPEYVIDKATKLETIYNRIHEVRMRFEVLLRDAEIEKLQALLRGEEKRAVEAQFAQRQQQLHADFAFVAACNIGNEAMDPDSIERLQVIAQQTWWRYFDDRLGLSISERERYPEETQTTLPVQEQLLADKARHVIPRTQNFIPDAEFGFKVDIPTHLYNYGEIYNLSITRGTLTTEERFKINEHIIQTIMMLERMPFPSSLRRVPEYAGTHHETLDGRGYPRKLTIDELSIPSRIMAIADIFEALTASDRPYKPAKKLSESLKILQRMKQDRHIDADLFALFLTTGVYLRYAQRYLDPAQIDEVDIEALIGS